MKDLNNTYKCPACQHRLTTYSGMWYHVRRCYKGDVPSVAFGQEDMTQITLTHPQSIIRLCARDPTIGIQKLVFKIFIEKFQTLRKKNKKVFEIFNGVFWQRLQDDDKKLVAESVILRLRPLFSDLAVIIKTKTIKRSDAIRFKRYVLCPLFPQDYKCDEDDDIEPLDKDHIQFYYDCVLSNMFVI